MRWQTRAKDRREAIRDRGKARHIVHVTGTGIGIAELEFEDDICIGAPVRLSAALGRSAAELRVYFKRRGWHAEMIR